MSDLVQDVKGVEKDYVKSWLFDLVGEIKRIEQYIESEQPKKKLAERLAEGFNGADVDYLCEKAKENALHRVIENNEKLQIIKNEDFEKAFEQIKSSVLESDKREMKKWIKEFQGE